MRMKDQKDYRESAQKHIEEAKAEWTIFGKTGIFILAVLGVIAFLALAWFVSNTSVTSLSGSISARNDMPYRLASVGERLEMEKNHLLSSTDNGTWGETELSSGNQQSYNSYIDNASGKTVDKNTTVKVVISLGKQPEPEPVYRPSSSSSSSGSSSSGRKSYRRSGSSSSSSRKSSGSKKKSSGGGDSINNWNLVN